MASEGKEDKDTSNSSKIQTDDSVQPGLKLVLKRLTYKCDADYFRKLQDTLCVWTGFFVFVSLMYIKANGTFRGGKSICFPFDKGFARK